MSKDLQINESSIQTYLNTVKGSLQHYSSNSDMNGFMRSAMLMIMESQQLKDCLKTEQGKGSLYHAMKYAASTGLSLNPQEGKAAIMAFGGKVQYQVMKNGLIELAMESGKVSFIISDTVRFNDDFKMTKTMDGDRYEYTPARKNRGDIDGFFAAIKLKDGACHVKYMTKEEVEAHRDAYSSSYNGNKSNSPWTKSFEGMGLKTVLKALFRNLSISPDIDKAVGIDDKEEVELDQEPEIRNVTDKGVSSEELAEKLEKKPEPEPVQTVIGEPKPKQEKDLW